MAKTAHNQSQPKDQTQAGDELGKGPSMSEDEKKRETALQKVNHSLYTSYPDLTSEKINIWKNTVFKEASLLELYYFANVAHAVKLNPDTHEIWAWKDKHGKIVVTVAEVGYRVNAERHPSYRGIDFGVVYDGDDFEVDFLDKQNPVKHKRKGIQTTKPIGAWAIAFRDKMPPIVSVVSMSEYSKAAENPYNAWNKNPSDMIAKVARTKALSVQFPVSGVIPEHEVTVKDGMHDYVDHHEEEVSQEELAQEQLNNKIAEALEVFEMYEGSDKERIGDTIRKFQQEKTLTIELLDEYIEHMQTNKA